ncbi:MAG: DNA cytosine methyltransferase [Patescibacteria group bacterium]
MKKKKSQTKKPMVLDLFAGVGGFSEGFILSGCDIVAHIEMDKEACETIRTRMVYHALRKKGKLEEYKKYLLGEKTREEIVSKYKLNKEIDSVIQEKISRDNYAQLIGEVKERLNGADLDIIIGGPPCQAYSHIGRGSDRKHMKRDPRKFLYQYYVEFLKALKPKVFIFENVPGLLSSGKGMYLNSMRLAMKAAGYNTEFSILNAAEYGVPQERRRVILIGWNSKANLKSYPVFDKVDRNYKVSDFLLDLPKLKSGEGSVATKFKSKSKILDKLGITNNFGVLLGHAARPNNKQDLTIYKMAVKEKNNGHNIKYNELPNKLKTHKNQTGFLDRFKVVDGAAASSHTVIAHISKDGHYYIHPDAEQNRSLTVREAARLQTFPDDFIFEGSRSAQYKQIGNAVPPMLSSLIANKLIKFF